jgi:hypothetical protein
LELSYPYVCESQSEIPEEAYKYLDKHIVESVGLSFSAMFPQFSKEFGKASQVIDSNWSEPRLALKKGLREWLAFIVVQSDRGNLFFNLQPEFMEKDGELFDEDYQMLPPSWKEVYRWFNSFYVTEKNHSLMDWWNTPFRFEARLDLDDYQSGSGATTDQVNKLVNTIGCKREMLRCWLLTENEDALFINEEACDQKVFHVRGKNLGIITEILDPREKLDEYLAHYLSGLSPKSFIW